MIAIIDYGAGNLFSVKNACDFLGIETEVTKDESVLERAKGIILPGVGAFPEAMKKLEASGLIDSIKVQAKKKPLLGICLGMQMLLDYSTEFEKTAGLGLIEGYVDLIDSKELKLPHIGWNDLKTHQESPLLKNTRDGDYVYFVHSYACVCEEKYILASTGYGSMIPAVIGKGNVFGAQFHPEKSADVGLDILRCFRELVEN